MLDYRVPLQPHIKYKNYLLKKAISSNGTSSKLPPGPKKLPIIGNILNMVSKDTPHAVLRNMAQKYGPLMHLQLGEVSAIVVSSPKVAKEFIVKNDVAFADRPEILTAKIIMYNCSDIAFAPYGSYWRQLRKICTLELLTNKKVQSFGYIREEEVKFLIGSMIKKSSSGSIINLTEMVTMLINTVTSKAAFGRLPKDQDLLVQGVQDMVDLGGGFSLADLFPSIGFLKVLTGMSYKVGKIHKSLDKILDKILGEYEKELEIKKVGNDENENFLDILYRLKDSGNLDSPISTDNIKAVILDVFSAGTDTSASTVEWAMAELLRNPEVLRKAQDEVRQVLKVKDLVQEDGDLSELKYLKLVIKETLRLHPIFPLLLPRECRESCEIDGYMIPLKTKVIVNAWALGRDPEYWNEPERFQPERFDNTSIDYSGNSLEYLPFGAGRRRCPGTFFALSNIELILSHLLYHFDWEIAGGVKPQDLDMNETIGAVCRRKMDLKLIATPYTPI
ncbi:premnaspirodiene oxygenase-like [Rutidosis leptorrhynchoides]|uniref:premnaspirodiene oxygenase-like n=1 Tax=Rutidosis leptorrhynchoides TaxID=125765 RepID=UPI003A99CEC3